MDKQPLLHYVDSSSLLVGESKPVDSCYQHDITDVACATEDTGFSEENSSVEKHITSLILLKYTAPVESFSSMPDISKGDEEVHEVVYCNGLKYSWLWFALFWLSVVFSLGLVLLFCYWYDWLKDRFQHSKITVKFNEKHDVYLSKINADDDLRKNDIFKGTSFTKADAVIVKAKETGQITICMIEKQKLNIDEKMFRILMKSEDRKKNDQVLKQLSKEKVVEVTLSFFKYRNLVYLYNEETDRFDRAHHFTLLPFSTIHTMGHTIGSQFAFNRLACELKKTLFGSNSIKTEVRNVVKLLLDEVLHPFYMFQVISVCVWLSEAYYVYAVAIAVISSISSILSMWETRTNMVKLKEMTSFHCGVNKLSQHDNVHQHYATNSTKKRSMLVSSSSEPVLSIDDAFSWKDISKHRVDSTELLPGDLIEIENDMVIPCDCVLLHGQTIMNEAMLTGESTPTKKVPIPKSGSEKDRYNCMRDKTHTLFCGTQVIMIKPSSLYESSEQEMVIAMVIQTGFQTAKGKLVLSILHPKPNQFSFYSDSMKFLFMMFLFGVAGISFSLYNQSVKKAPLGEMIISCFDLLTTIVPPALPIAMTATVSMAISRLKKKGIFCISPPRINVSGRINLACFDKTNTLTRDGLDLCGVVPIGKKGFEHMIKDTDLLSQLAHATNSLLHCMSCCHNLSYVFGKLVGDPLDVKLFEATTWDLVESDKSSTDQNNKRTSANSITITSPDKSTSFSVLKIFDFKSSLQRMSVVVQDDNTGDLHFFVKGSAEMLKTLSHSQTIPGDFANILYKYAHKGYRVLGCASRVVKYRDIVQTLEKSESLGRHIMDPLVAKYADQLTREEVESKLDFLGLICMENKLKPETPSVIRTLTKANLRSVVITGDNPYTSICVARKCSMIPKGKTIFLSEFIDEENMTHQVNTNPSINEDIFSDDKSIGSNPMKHYLPLFDKIIWRNANDPRAPVLSSRDIIRKDFRSENYELAIIGEIFDSIVFAHKEYVEKTNENAKLGKGTKIDYVDTENPSLLHRILSSCHIYARVSPSGKMKVVEEMIKMGYMAVMCGDGSNDVEALKAAHVGISLSEAEASIAAPFTSVQNSIRSVVEVIKEGRASLSSSFQMFKYMALYSLFEFFAAVLIFRQDATIGDTQYLYIDMFIILPVVLLMANSKASETLNKEKPPESLFSRFVLTSLLGQIFWGFALMLGVYFEILFDTPWYKPGSLHKDPKDNIISYETTITYLACCFAVLNSAVSQSISEPFKRPLITHNFLYVFLLVVLYLFTAYILFEPCTYLKSAFQFINFPMEFKLRLFGYCAAHYVIGYFWEIFLIWRWPFRQPLKGLTIYNIIRFIKAITCASDKSWLGKILVKLLQREKRKWKPYKQLRSNLGIQKVRERMSMGDHTNTTALKKPYDKSSTREERTSLLI